MLADVADFQRLLIAGADFLQRAGIADAEGHLTLVHDVIQFLGQQKQVLQHGAPVPVVLHNEDEFSLLHVEQNIGGQIADDVADDADVLLREGVVPVGQVQIHGAG